MERLMNLKLAIAVAVYTSILSILAGQNVLLRYPADYKVEDKIKFPMALRAGKVEEQTLIYRGKENVQRRMELTITVALISLIGRI